jgi:hypothetical protein
MTDAGVGFDDYAAGDETDRMAAWRARLEREGKLGTAGSLRDLIRRRRFRGDARRNCVKRGNAYSGLA